MRYYWHRSRPDPDIHYIVVRRVIFTSRPDIGYLCRRRRVFSAPARDARARYLSARRRDRRLYSDFKRTNFVLFSIICVNVEPAYLLTSTYIKHAPYACASVCHSSISAERVFKGTPLRVRDLFNDMRTHSTTTYFVLL